MEPDANVSHLMGCYGAFDSATGLLHVHPYLKALKIERITKVFPMVMIVGDDNKGNVIVSADGVQTGEFPKKFIKEIKI